MYAKMKHVFLAFLATASVCVNALHYEFDSPATSTLDFVRPAPPYHLPQRSRIEPQRKTRSKSFPQDYQRHHGGWEEHTGKVTRSTSLEKTTDDDYTGQGFLNQQIYSYPQGRYQQKHRFHYPQQHQQHQHHQHYESLTPRKEHAQYSQYIYKELPEDTCGYHQRFYSEYPQGNIFYREYPSSGNNEGFYQVFSSAGPHCITSGYTHKTSVPRRKKRPKVVAVAGHGSSEGFKEVIVEHSSTVTEHTEKDVSLSERQEETVLEEPLIEDYEVGSREGRQTGTLEGTGENHELENASVEVKDVGAAAEAT